VSSLGDLKPVYLIHGTEELLLEQAVERLRSRLAEAGALEFNFHVFDGDSATGDSIVCEANTLPFAAERRLVIVRNTDHMSREHLDALATYAADPAPFTVLVLVAEKMARNTKLYKAVDALGGVAEYKAPRKSEYPDAVRRLFADRGRTIDREGAELLVRAVGFDLRRISVEMDKVVAYAGDRVELTRADVEQVVSVTAATSVFDFTGSLGDRDCARALRLLNDLVEDGESVYGIHAMALRYVRDLLSARALLNRGEGSVAEIARALSRPDWQVKALPRQAQNFSAEDLVGFLRLAAETEAKMKTSRDERLAFECWVVRVCGGS